MRVPSKDRNIVLPFRVTNTFGAFVTKGIAPSNVSNGWEVQARYVGNSSYIGSNSSKMYYSTQKHNTTLSLLPPKSISLNEHYRVSGALTDSNTGIPLRNQPISFKAVPIT